MQPRWPIGFRRNYHLLSYFLPGLFASTSLCPFPPSSLSPEKNLSSFLPQGDIARTRSLVSASACPVSPNPSWRPDSPVLRSLLPFSAHSLSRSLPPFFSLSLSRSFVFWTLLFHLFFHIVFSLPFAFFSSSLSLALARTSSIIGPLHLISF